VPKRTYDERLQDHAREVEQGQKALRASITETERWLDEAEAMMERHRHEQRDEMDWGDNQPVYAAAGKHNA
jgi:hypothetical protein